VVGDEAQAGEAGLGNRGDAFGDRNGTRRGYAHRRRVTRAGPRRRHELRSGHVDPLWRATAFVHGTPACRVQTRPLAEWALLVLGEPEFDAAVAGIEPAAG